MSHTCSERLYNLHPPSSTATEQLKEECFNPCLNRDWGDLPRKITEKPEENHPWRHGDKPRVPEVCASPSPLNKQHPRDRHQIDSECRQASFSQLPSIKVLSSLVCNVHKQMQRRLGVFSLQPQCLRCAVLTTALQSVALRKALPWAQS